MLCVGIYVYLQRDDYSAGIAIGIFLGVGLVLVPYALFKFVAHRRARPVPARDDHDAA